MEEQEVQGYIVDGYLFSTEKEAKIAQKELQGIIYLQKNNDMKDLKVVKQIYQKILKQGLFKTAVGINYLKQLQNFIISKEGQDDILPIPVGDRDDSLAKNTSMRERKAYLELDDVGWKYRKRFRLAVIVIGVLSACVVFMMIVASTTNQPNILNYEEKLIDKYEHWEQELEEREKLLKE